MFCEFSYFVLTLILILLGILDFLSYFSTPSRPKEYYTRNIKSVIYFFITLNLVLKLSVCFTMIFYFRLLNVILEREKQEMLLNDNEDNNNNNYYYTKNNINSAKTTWIDIDNEKYTDKDVIETGVNPNIFDSKKEKRAANQRRSSKTNKTLDSNHSTTENDTNRGHHHDDYNDNTKAKDSNEDNLFERKFDSIRNSQEEDLFNQVNNDQGYSDRKYETPHMNMGMSYYDAEKEKLGKITKLNI